MSKMLLVFSGLVVSALLQTYPVSADLPINCTYSNAQGEWIFYVGQEGHDNTINCTQDFANNTDNFKYEVKIDLQYPDIAIDDEGNIGFWTMMYIEGFEVVIGDKKYFAFFKYEHYPNESMAYNYCGETSVGWVHDTDGTNWGCYVGKKTTEVPRRVISDKLNLFKPQSSSPFVDEDSDVTLAYVNHINRAQSTWSAKTYPEFAGRTMAHMAGGVRRTKAPKVVTARREDLEEAATLPENFDWRSVNGVNYVSPVRDQSRCGSCYAFASMAMAEARFRVFSNNTMKPVFSTQDIVDCSIYSQGCKGGYIYLIGGKYAEDFGLVEEHCYRYQMGEKVEGTCRRKMFSACERYHMTGYEYIGGYYGAGNEVLIRLNLVKYGPIAVDLQLYNDFLRYKSGIYQHTKVLPRGVKFDPFVSISHSVLIVGYGTDRTNPENPIDYWIVKNSWGHGWGENGYFRITRGINECGIESAAVQSFPIIRWKK